MAASTNIRPPLKHTPFDTTSPEGTILVSNEWYDWALSVRKSIDTLRTIVGDPDGDGIVTDVDKLLQADYVVFARDMLPTVTGGCSALTTIEFGVNQPNFHVLLFTPGVDESADFHCTLPFSWAGRKYKVQVYWGHGDLGTSFDVVWEVTANSTGDQETVILDFVGGAVITDVGGVAGDLYIAELSSAIPISSFSNEDGDLISVRIYHRGTHASDNIDIEPGLIAVRFVLSDEAVDLPPNPILDPLTLLQTRFIASDAQDESYYAGGPPTQSGGTVSSGFFDVNRDHTASPFTPSSLTYTPASLIAVGGQPLTVEFISDWQATPNASYLRLFTFLTNASDVATSHRFGYDGNTGKVAYDNAGFGVEYTSTSNFTAATHFAIVFGSTSLRVYFNGVQVWTQAGDSRPTAGLQGRVIAGDDTGYSSGVTQYKILGFRVRQEEVYTGTSFTPPTAIPAP
jgi:hypothetical protein